MFEGVHFSEVRAEGADFLDQVCGEGCGVNLEASQHPQHIINDFVVHEQGRDVERKSRLKHTLTEKNTGTCQRGHQAVESAFGSGLHVVAYAVRLSTGNVARDIVVFRHPGHCRVEHEHFGGRHEGKALFHVHDAGGRAVQGGVAPVPRIATGC